MEKVKGSQKTNIIDSRKSTNLLIYSNLKHSGEVLIGQAQQDQLQKQTWRRWMISIFLQAKLVSVLMI